eukprot:7751855-Alexandrium_andersonii.AAC.1
MARRARGVEAGSFLARYFFAMRGAEALCQGPRCHARGLPRSGLVGVSSIETHATGHRSCNEHA